jgi:hypothetical protein
MYELVRPGFSPWKKFSFQAVQLVATDPLLAASVFFSVACAFFPVLFVAQFSCVLP